MTSAGSVPIPPAGKGRPTPKRSDKERRTGPVPPPPRTRKEAAQRLRAQQATGRKDLRAGYAAGDETRLLPRDRGPARSLVRDVVDSRRNVGVLLLPLAVLLVASQFVGTERVVRIATTVWIGGLLAMLIDIALLALRVGKALATLPPGEQGAGRGRAARHVGYAVLRSTVLRRLRMPPPKVSAGDAVQSGGSGVPGGRSGRR